MAATSAFGLDPGSYRRNSLINKSFAMLADAPTVPPTQALTVCAIASYLAPPIQFVSPA